MSSAAYPVGFFFGFIIQSASMRFGILTPTSFRVSTIKAPFGRPLIFVCAVAISATAMTHKNRAILTFGFVCFTGNCPQVLGNDGAKRKGSLRCERMFSKQVDARVSLRRSEIFIEPGRYDSAALREERQVTWVAHCAPQGARAKEAIRFYKHYAPKGAFSLTTRRPLTPDDCLPSA